MERLVAAYADKLLRAGLADPERPPLVAGLDDRLVWNAAAREPDAAPLRRTLEGLFGLLEINSLVLLRPAGLHAAILELLAREALDGAASPEEARITPEDCETRTFLHDLPVRPLADAASLARTLAGRNCCILPGVGVLATGSVSPEQGFVTVSSACFACFVRFFSSLLRELRSGIVRPERLAVLDRVRALLPPPRTDLPELAAGPFADRGSALEAMVRAGRAVVDYGLVDSFFGNVSCLLPGERGGLLLISQTGSSLDALEGCIDPCFLDGSSTACLTASSELTAHARSYAADPDLRAILHGHPRFAVIRSMDCPRPDAGSCAVRRAGLCHARCPELRTLDAPGAEGVRIVPGEVGTGPTGLCNTLPPALAANGAAVVHGHGVFAAGATDFREPFRLLLEVENACRRACLEEIDNLRRVRQSEDGA